MIARLVSFFGATLRKPHGAAIQCSLLTILCSLLARPLIPSRAVRLAPAAGKIAGRTELVIRIHPRVDTLGMLAVAAQHRVGFLGSFFVDANRQYVPLSRGILNACGHCGHVFTRRMSSLQKFLKMRRALDRNIHVGPPRATDKATRRMGVAKVRLRTTITGSLYHSVLFNGTPSSAGKT